MDKFSVGLTSGVISGIGLNLFSFASEKAGISKLPIASWTAIIIYGRTPPFSSGEIWFAALGNVFFAGFLGVVFSFLVPVITKERLYLKGWFFSIIIWFSIYAVTALFKVDGTLPLELNTVISNAVVSSIFGLLLAYFVNLLSGNAEAAFSHKAKLRPAMKPNRDDNKE